MSNENIFEIGPLGPENVEQLEKNHWNISLNGGESSPLGKEINLVQISSDFGVLTIGRRPEGYPGWSFREIGGGGSVTIPFAVSPEGELLVGLALEDRQNLGGPTWCAIGGFVQPGQSHAEAQKQKLCEKAHVCGKESFALDGLPFISNRLFFVGDAKKDEGVHGFALEISYDDLELDREKGNWSIKPGAITGYKKPENVRLFKYEEAVAITPDVFFLSMAARLIAQLKL